jgi:hypothetical protein
LYLSDLKPINFDIYFCKLGEKMKPFDLEKDLAGEKVITRDGDEVTEICHFKTANDNYCIVAAIVGLPHFFRKDGSSTAYDESLDLFMDENKKYINIYKSNLLRLNKYKKEIIEKFLADLRDGIATNEEKEMFMNILAQKPKPKEIK